MVNASLPTLLTMWVIVTAAIIYIRWGRQNVALVTAYLVSLGLIHWVGPMVHALPWYEGFDNGFTLRGTQLSVAGLICFGLGSLVVAPFVLGFRHKEGVAEVFTPDRKLPKMCVIGGIIAYIAPAFIGDLPSVSAILSTGEELVVVGLALGCYLAWSSKDYKDLSRWVLATLILPLTTVVTRGFIGFGAVAALVVLVFVAGLVRSRLKVTVAAIVIGYLGLTVFVNYMRDREQIRRTVWQGQSYGNRFDQLILTAEHFEWFDPHDQLHLDLLDGRLNQSNLVGASINYIEANNTFAHGDTLWFAFMGLIPRVLWPDKPQIAGSGNLVSTYTGIQFAEHTSVGIGHVMEFYVNFGSVGVWIGFIVMGTIVTVLDSIAAEKLKSGDLPGFILCFLPGLGLLQVGGALVEALTVAVCGLIVALLLRTYHRRGSRHGLKEARLGAAGTA